MEQDNTTNLKILRNRVKRLLKKPQPKQRTPEWFKQRQTRVTASEAASCFYKTEKVCQEYVKEFNITNFKFKDTEPLNPYDTKEQYIIKKCNSFFGLNDFKDNPYTLWGKKYEDVASRLYAKLKNTTIHEFGLLSHSRLKWLAASPDGITSDGVMLEIKCPKSRKIIDTAPPLYYWIQCQIQLECVNLDFCDFLECEIEELLSEDEFLNTVQESNQDLGIILQELTNTPLVEFKYVYPPINLTTKEDYLTWKNDILQSTDKMLYKPIYYKITKYNIIRVKRNKKWFEDNKYDIKATWDIITRYQNNPEDFEKYKESMELIKNKSYWDKYHSTICNINDNESEYCFNQNEFDKVKEYLCDIASTN